jgi:hypothetical protein
MTINVAKKKKQNDPRRKCTSAIFIENAGTFNTNLLALNLDHLEDSVTNAGFNSRRRQQPVVLVPFVATIHWIP